MVVVVAIVVVVGRVVVPVVTVVVVGGREVVGASVMAVAGGGRTRIRTANAPRCMASTVTGHTCNPRGR